MVSARYGLVDPREELEPYDLALAELPAAGRRRWSEQVASDLEQTVGPIAGMTVELHAGAVYRQALERPLEARRAILTAPLAGLGIGQQLAWYGCHASD